MTTTNLTITQWRGEVVTKKGNCVATFTILTLKPQHCCDCKRQLRPRHTSGHRSHLCVSCAARIACTMNNEVNQKQSWQGIAKQEGYGWKQQTQFGVIDLE